MALSKAEKKRLCEGCRYNRYNMGIGYRESPRDAPVGCKECWHLAKARVVDKEVYYSPSDINPTPRKRTLSCWHNNMGYGRITKRASPK